MKGIILCAGKGSRLRPYSYSRPKHLLPVANQAIILNSISQMVQSGIREIGIVISPQFRDFFVKEIGYGTSEYKIQYIEQFQPTGLAKAVQLTRDFIGEEESFIVMLGDNFYTGTLQELVDTFNRERPDALLTILQVEDPSSYGIVSIEGNLAVEIEEKPSTPKSPYAVIGIYIFTPHIFSVIESLTPSKRGEYEITDAIAKLIDENKKVRVHLTDAWWRDTGQLTDWLACNKWVLDHQTGEVDATAKIINTRITGPVVIGAGSKIQNSTIVGPSIIGANTLIQNSWIGPYTSIGDQSELDHCTIRNSILLKEARISFVSQEITESVIGEGTKIEGRKMESYVLRIGDGSSIQF